jgi:O-methyltransferase involved in polyketide biosynthesis
MELPGPLRRGSHTISPTAHYTGYVWARHRLGDPGLATGGGRLLYGLGQLALTPVELLGGPTLAHFLLARHRIIDRLLTAELESGRVTQVVELASGMSPRGLELVRRHAGLTYVEVDLPGMVERKRAALARIGTDHARHRLRAADVFGDDLATVFGGLDPDSGVAVVTEGLLNYFPTDRVEDLWRRVARELGTFACGVYLADLHVRAQAGWTDRAFAAGLGVAVRGRVHLHYADQQEVHDALSSAGFAAATLHAPAEFASVLPGMLAAGADRVRVVEARTRPLLSLHTDAGEPTGATS